MGKKREELRTYLSNKGLTEDNLNDISNANIAIHTLDLEIQRKDDEIAALQKWIDNFDNLKSQQAGTAYVTELKKQLSAVSNILEKLDSSSVKPISLSLEFDVEAASDTLFNEFKSLFEGRINQNKHKEDTILREILYCVSSPRIERQRCLS